MTEGLVRTLAWSVVWLVGIGAGLIYTLAYLLVTGRSLFEMFKVRTDDEIQEDRTRRRTGRIHVIGGEEDGR